MAATGGVAPARSIAQAAASVSSPPAASVAAQPTRWEGFPGPSVTPAGSNPSFAVVPFQGKAWGGDVYVAAVEPLRVAGSELVTRGSSAEVLVPGALVAPKPARLPQKGDAVLVAYSVSINSQALYGVVSDVSEESGEKAYLVKYLLHDVGERSFPAEKLYVLDGSLSFGGKVAYRANDDKEWTVGTYVGPAPGGHWVVHFSEVVQRREVRLLPWKPRKKGERVWAESGATSSYDGAKKKESWRTLDSAVVEEVLDGGAAYRIRFEKNEDGRPSAADGVLGFQELHTPFDTAIRKK